MHSFQVFAFVLGCAARADRQTLLQIPWEATEAMLMRDLGATQQVSTFWIGEDYYFKGIPRPFELFFQNFWGVSFLETIQRALVGSVIGALVGSVYAI